METAKNIDQDEIIERVHEETKDNYIAQHSAEAWEKLSKAEKYDLCRAALEKHYDAETKGYKIQ